MNKGLVAVATLLALTTACAANNTSTGAIHTSASTSQPIAKPEVSPTPPPSPRVGVRYAVGLYTHCGIEFARFGDRLWQTSRLDDGNGNPPAGWRNPSDLGTMELINTDSAVFQDDDGHVLQFNLAPPGTTVPICS
jgi:hypothetical protein